MKPRKQFTPTNRLSRFFSPGREFATAKAFADFTREAEVVRSSGLLI